MSMKKHKNLVFIDIETVSGTQQFEDLTEEYKTQWTKKAGHLRGIDDLSVDEAYSQRSAIYAEFGKIVCISIGYCVKDKQEECHLRIKSITNSDEKSLLAEFCELMENKFDERSIILCAHNGKEFDYPYLARRMVINEVKLPVFLQLSGKKPWQVKHIDTMELWKFGDWKSYTSLELLTTALGIPSTKTDLDGSMVSKVFYELDDLDRIARYCAQDVIATAQIYFRFVGKKMIESDHIHIIV